METKWTIGALVGTVGLVVGVLSLDPPKPPQAAARATRPLTPRQKADRHLGAADARCEAAITNSLAEVSRLFAKGRTGAKGYADEVLSWNGKWELVKGHAASLQQRLFGKPEATDWFGKPYTGDWFGRDETADDANTHERYLTDEFTRRVLDPDDLQREIARALEAFVSEVEAAENDLLVKLRADVFLAHKPADPALGPVDDAFKREFESHLAAMSVDLPLAVGQGAATFGGSWVVGNIATNVAVSVATSLGMSTTILGSTAAMSAVTFGASVVIGFIVDHLINDLLTAVGHDPADKVAAAVCGSLDTLEGAVAGALRAEMETVHTQRAKVRRATIQALLADGGGP